MGCWKNPNLQSLHWSPSKFSLHKQMPLASQLDSIEPSGSHWQAKIYFHEFHDDNFLFFSWHKPLQRGKEYKSSWQASHFSPIMLALQLHFASSSHSSVNDPSTLQRQARLLKLILSNYVQLWPTYLKSLTIARWQIWARLTLGLSFIFFGTQSSSGFGSIATSGRTSTPVRPISRCFSSH